MRCQVISDRLGHVVNEENFKGGLCDYILGTIFEKKYLVKYLKELHFCSLILCDIAAFSVSVIVITDFIRN